MDDGSATKYLYLGGSELAQPEFRGTTQKGVSPGEIWVYSTKHRGAKPFQYCALAVGNWTNTASGDAPGITICVFGPGPRQNMGFLLSFMAVSVYAQNR
jgi:hypothetical protein